MISCKDFEVRHTGAAIARQTDHLVRDIPHLYSEKVELLMTADSAQNMIKAYNSNSAESKMIDQHFKCQDHVLNNCLKDALDVRDVSAAVKMCTKLADAVHRSNLKPKASKKKCKELGSENERTQKSG